MQFRTSIWIRTSPLLRKTGILLALITTPVLAQFDLGGAKTYENRHRHSFWVDMPFNHEDFAIGATYRHSIVADQFLGIFGSFQARTFGKKVLVQDGPNFFFQLKEYRYLVTGGLDKKFWINNRIDLFIGAGGGFTFVDYRGTGEGTFMGHTIEKKEGLIPVVRAGVSFKFSRYIFLRAGYLYFDAKTVGGHRAFLALGGQI